MTLMVNGTKYIGTGGTFISSEVIKMTLMVNGTRYIGTEWPKKTPGLRLKVRSFPRKSSK